VKPCFGKGFGISSQTGVNRAAKAMSQHHACAVAIGRCRLIKTCMAIGAAGFERDFLKHQRIKQDWPKENHNFILFWLE
jgi:hypothetical protein